MAGGSIEFKRKGMTLFQPEFGLIFWMLVVFLIILGILAKYAWPVIIRGIEQRAELIESGVKYTKEAEKQLNETHLRIQKMMGEVHQKQLEALQETERMKRELIEDAKKTAALEAQKVMEQAEVSIGQARREAELHIRKQVGRLALEVAGKLLRSELEDEARQTALVNKILDEMDEK